MSISASLGRVVRVAILQRVAHARLEPADADAVGQLEIRQVALGHRQMPEVLGVAAGAERVAGVVPDVRRGSANPQVRQEESVELSGEPPLRYGDGVPAGLAEVGRVARRLLEVIPDVVVHRQPNSRSRSRTMTFTEFAAPMSVSGGRPPSARSWCMIRCTTACKRTMA